MLINTPNLRALNTGYHTEFQTGLSRLRAGSEVDSYQTIATDVPALDARELFGWINETRGLRKWVGDRIIQSLSAGDYIIESEPYEETVGVERLAILNDRYGVYAPRFVMMGENVRRHPNSIVWPHFASALTLKGYDKVPFIGTTHPGLDKDGSPITWSNYQGDGGQPFWCLIDDMQPLKPVIRAKREDYRFVARENPEDERVFMQDKFLYGTSGNFGLGFGLPQTVYGSKQTLDDTNLNAAIQALMSMKLDYEKPAGCYARKLVTGPANRAKALEAVKRERLANGASNINYGAVEVMIVPELLGV